MTVLELEAASDRVGERRGWDFRKVRAVRDDAPWDYEEIVIGSFGAAGDVLDIGTGGGELLRTLAARSSWSRVIALDHAERMATVAVDGLVGIAHVAVADVAGLPLMSESFDLILERHASVDVTEVSRVLRPGGAFVTQQVGPRNTQSIFDAFGWGSNWEQFADDDPPPQRCDELARRFAALGHDIERVDEYEVGYAFEDLDSLVFFLKAAPFPEDFDPGRHVDAVNRLLAANLSDRGIETTEHRELLIVRGRA